MRQEDYPELTDDDFKTLSDRFHRTLAEKAVIAEMELLVNVGNPDVSEEAQEECRRSLRRLKHGLVQARLHLPGNLPRDLPV